jgi:hypothetical protein
MLASLSIGAAGFPQSMYSIMTWFFSHGQTACRFGGCNTSQFGEVDGWLGARGERCGPHSARFPPRHTGHALLVDNNEFYRPE